MKEIASIMALLLKNPEDEAVKKEAAERTAKLTASLPLYKYALLHKNTEVNKAALAWRLFFPIHNMKIGRDAYAI